MTYQELRDFAAILAKTLGPTVKGRIRAVQANL
jgi:hypothetical protein